MPAGGAWTFPARLDGAALDALVLPDLDLLGFLRAFLLGPRGEPWACAAWYRPQGLRPEPSPRPASAPFRDELALALLFLGQFRRLAGRQLLLLAPLLLAQLGSRTSIAAAGCACCPSVAGPCSDSRLTKMRFFLTSTWMVRAFPLESDFLMISEVCLRIRVILFLGSAEPCDRRR